MKAVEKIREKLIKEFNPSYLEVIDESHMHAGHAGAPEGGESHFKVRMVSEAFTGKSRVERQRLVHKSLADDLATYIHALSLDLKNTSEAA